MVGELEVTTRLNVNRKSSGGDCQRDEVTHCPDTEDPGGGTVFPKRNGTSFGIQSRGQ